MNDDTRKLVLLNPNLLKTYDFHGVEFAAYAFEIHAYQKGYVCIEAVKRDKSGHFFKDDGAPCPHRNGYVEPKENAESVKRKEEGVKAFKSALSGGMSAQMQTSDGRKVSIEKGTEAYGVEHMRMRRFDSGDVSSDAEFDKVIDGVAKAIANAEPYESRGRIVFEYKGYRAICDEHNGELIFISGYKIEKGGR